MKGDLQHNSNIDRLSKLPLNQLRIKSQLIKNYKIKAFAILHYDDTEMWRNLSLQ